MSDTAVLARRIEHQDRFWTGLEDAPERPDDSCFKPCSLSDLQGSLYLAEFQAASDLAGKIPESRSTWVENLKAVGAMLAQAEARRTGRMFYAGADAKNGGRVVFFAWEVE